MTFIYDILKGMLEIAEDDTFAKLFLKAVSHDDYLELYCHNDYDSCVKRSVIYDWWYDYLKANVKDKFLRNSLNDALYDEDIYAFLEEIHDKYLSYITSVYPDKPQEEERDDDHESSSDNDSE
jgi:hypothetical protein